MTYWFGDKMMICFSLAVALAVVGRDTVVELFCSAVLVSVVSATSGSMNPSWRGKHMCRIRAGTDFLLSWRL